MIHKLAEWVQGRKPELGGGAEGRGPVGRAAAAGFSTERTATGEGF